MIVSASTALEVAAFKSFQELKITAISQSSFWLNCPFITLAGDLERVERAHHIKDSVEEWRHGKYGKCMH